MASLNDCIKFYLNLDDTNIIIFKNILTANIIISMQPNLFSPIVLTADASHPVIIRLKKQRVLCNACRKRSMTQSDLINKGCYISNTSKQKILSALTEDHSITSIAREHNVSVNTVQRVLEACSSKFYDDFDHLPKHLALMNSKMQAKSFTVSV